MPVLVLKQLDFLKDIELLHPLIVASHAETDPLVKLGLNIDFYLQANLITIGAFAGDDLVAIAIFLLTPMQHNIDTLHAVSEIFYVKPHVRHTPVLKRLLDAVEHQAFLAGAKRVLIGSPKRSKYFEAIGYAEAEITYQKFLTGTQAVQENTK